MSKTPRKHESAIGRTWTIRFDFVSFCRDSPCVFMTVKRVLQWREWWMVAMLVPLTPSVLLGSRAVIDVFALGAILPAQQVLAPLHTVIWIPACWESTTAMIHINTKHQMKPETTWETASWMCCVLNERCCCLFELHKDIQHMSGRDKYKTNLDFI